MNIRHIPAVAVLAAAMVLVGVAGCGGAPPAPPSPPPAAAPTAPKLPPRPVELWLDGVDPCSLLTDAQRHEFGVYSGKSLPPGNGTPIQGPGCDWSNFPGHPDNSFGGTAVLNHGAEYALGREPLRSVDGFAATTTTSTGSDPKYYCVVLVDVAPGQALGADYDNLSKDYPGMNRELACDKAMRLAAAMLATLRAIKDK